MDTKEQRRLLYKEITTINSSCRKIKLDEITGKMRLMPYEDHESVRILRECLSTEEALQALDVILHDALDTQAMLILKLIDDGIGAADRLNLALVNWDTKQNLAPKMDQYHVEYSDYQIEEQQKTGE